MENETLFSCIFGAPWSLERYVHLEYVAIVTVRFQTVQAYLEQCIQRYYNIL